MKKLLLVDDDSYLVHLLSSYLSSQGFIVYSVNNVTSAFVIIKNNKPDLIITDIMMKHLNGYDFIKLLKLDMLLLDVPVIFLTAKGLTNDRIKGYNLGCHAYLTKPFNPQELLAIIKNIFHHMDILKRNSIKKYKVLRKSKNNRLYNILTYREKTVLQLILRGYMNKEIAINLNISLRNVEKYVSRLLNKTNSRNRIELVKLFLQN